jgi:adenine-specific DNA-methyltransferase
MADFDVAVLRQRLAAPPRKAKGHGKLLVQLLSHETQELYDNLAVHVRTHALGTMASVDIGAVTGANDFFVLRRGEEPDLAEELIRPAVSKAIHIRGARFGADDLVRLQDAGARCLLFVSGKHTSQALLATARGYLHRGEQAGIPARYKCRVRTPWHAVPLPKHGAPDLFLTYCSAEFPRMVVNAAAALHTNTVHGVKLRSGDDPHAFAAGFYNSLTLLSAELVGRSYGGGVLKLEPTEAESLLLPPIPRETASELTRVDELLRGRDLIGVLDIIDRIVLMDGLGLTAHEVGLLRSGADRLRARRQARNRPAS